MPRPETHLKLPQNLVAALAEIEAATEARSVSKTAVTPTGGEVRLTLKELVKAADVSERTIRYYIQQGVLPPPQGAGPASRYGLEHLTRLSLVRRLKSALLPLSQIKQLLAELMPEELEQVADQLSRDLMQGYPVMDDKERPERVTGSVTGNLRRVADETGLEVFRPVELLEEGDPPTTASEPVAPPNLESLSFAGRWNRISLAPGLELHYQEGGPQDSGAGRERLAHLVELALRLYR